MPLIHDKHGEQRSDCHEAGKPEPPVLCAQSERCLLGFPLLPLELIPGRRHPLPLSRSFLPGGVELVGDKLIVQGVLALHLCYSRLDPLIEDACEVALLLIGEPLKVPERTEPSIERTVRCRDNHSVARIEISLQIDDGLRCG